MSGDMEPFEKFVWERDKLMLVYTVLGLLQIVVSGLHYNHMNIGISVNLGWLTMIIGIVIASMGWQELKKMGRAPEGCSPLRTTNLVDTGIYSVVRHPQYLGFLMFVPALVLISQHWLSAILGISWGLLFYRDILKEEKGNITKFGEEYAVYMGRVPGLNPAIGIIKLLRVGDTDESKRVLII
jgi:protein-S-isoprenylcysteine O-methyltransferase Ste14